MMSVEDRLKAAARHRAAGDTSSAASLLESILDYSPGHCEALTALAEIHFENGDGEPALQLLNEALRRDRSHCGARNLLAKLLLTRNQLREATELVEETLELVPSNSRACVLRAEIHVLADQHEQAETVLQDALQSQPNDPVLLSALAEFYAALKQNRAALRLTQFALAQAPDDPRHLARLGCLLAELGDHEKAINLLEAAHLKLPTDPIVTLYLAECQAALGLSREAKMLAKRLTVRFPGLLAGWLLLIRLEALKGDTREVFAAFLKQIKNHPDKTAALISLAMAYRSIGYLSKPIRLLQPFLENSTGISSKHRTQALTVLRDCMLASDNLDDLQKTVSVRPSSGQANAVMTTAESEALKDPLEVFSHNDLLIDPALSSLDALVLLRFAARETSGPSCRRVYGAAHLAPIIDLVGDMTFVALDSQEGLDTLKTAPAPLPLSATITMPPQSLRSCRQKLPYIVPGSESRHKWRMGLEKFPRPLVGLAWDEHRSGLLLEDYRPLLNARDGFSGTFVSVMWGNGRRQLKNWPQVIDCGTHFDSLSDLSALISEIDLLIGPDGLPSHVAGAMGCPAIVLTQPAHPWYWHANDGRATWYPSVQIIKTDKFGHWSNLAEGLAKRLTVTINGLCRNPTSVAIR